MTPGRIGAVRALLTAATITFSVAACTKQNTQANNRDTMTQRQKDSVLSQSGLPGAKGVGQAMKAADSAKAHQTQLDSASQP